jgi:ABC-2 type transport system permease protein
MTTPTITPTMTTPPTAALLTEGPSWVDARHERREIAGLEVTERRVMRSEWIKFRSVRSNLIAFSAAAIVAVGFGAIFSSAGSRRGPNEAVDSVSLSLAGLNLSRLIIGVLGVLLVSSEYSSGLIRTTLASVSSRLSVLRAKSVVFATVTLVVAGVAAFAAFFVGQSLYGGVGGSAAISDPGVLRAVVGAAAYCVGVGLLGLGLGFLLRSTAGGIGVLFATLLLIPGLAGLLPWSWSETATKYLPSNAGEAFTSVTRTKDLLSPTVGALVFAAWVIALLVAAGVALQRRDA